MLNISVQNLLPSYLSQDDKVDSRAHLRIYITHLAMIDNVFSKYKSLPEIVIISQIQGRAVKREDLVIVPEGWKGVGLYWWELDLLGMQTAGVFSCILKAFYINSDSAVCTQCSFWREFELF